MEGGAYPVFGLLKKSCVSNVLLLLLLVDSFRRSHHAGGPRPWCVCVARSLLLFLGGRWLAACGRWAVGAVAETSRQQQCVVEKEYHSYDYDMVDGSRS